MIASSASWALSPDQSGMRDCVNGAKNDPAYADVSVGRLCRCVISEWEMDFKSTPSSYQNDWSNKGYYSQKEEQATNARVKSAIRGHFEYCAILQRN
jgi:hypothetical protein